MTFRVPPSNLAAERSALGSVLIAPSAIDDLGDLSADDFVAPVNRDVFEAMREIARRGRPIDLVTLADELKARGKLGRIQGGETGLVEMANEVPTAANARHYAKLVHDAAVKRRLIAVCSEIASSAYGDVDADELLATARQQLAAVELGSVSGGPTPIGQDVGPTLDSIEKRAKQPEAYFLPTGIAGFDEIMTGLRGGNLIVVAARPGQGKSAWALDILLHAADLGIPALLFSYEMSKMEIIERAISKRASINGREIIQGRLSSEQWKAMWPVAGKIAELPVWLDTRPMPIHRICSEARRWWARQTVVADPNGRRKLAVVCVDYIGLIESTGDEDTRALEIAKMTGSLKRLAAELDIPIIAISQLNRESAKAGRKPMISDLRDSGSIEQDANMILFPWWEGTPPMFGKHPAQIIVGKNRGGPTGEIDVQWEAQFTRFTDREYPEGERGPVQEQLL